jgi:hypothetical protein
MLHMADLITDRTEVLREESVLHVGLEQQAVADSVSQALVCASPARSVAIGPDTPGWGSWDWVGADLVPELARWYRTSPFDWEELPEADVLLVVKHPVRTQVGRGGNGDPPIIYCPIDHYGSAAEIDADRDWLRHCSRIVIHCERLRKYFAPYAPVEYIDHHVKFVSPSTSDREPNGPILWVGVRSNLPALVTWANTHPLPRELILLTNPEHPSDTLDPADFGFRGKNRVQIETWSPERHWEWLPKVAGALDIKGDDFRSRHKPPAKAIDFLAAGVPLAMNADSSSVEHLARLGFDVVDPDDHERWFSPEYREETQRFGTALREILSLERIARRFRRVIEEVLQERRRPTQRADTELVHTTH